MYFLTVRLSFLLKSDGTFQLATFKFKFWMPRVSERGRQIKSLEDRVQCRRRLKLLRIVLDLTDNDQDMLDFAYEIELYLTKKSRYE